MQPNTKRAHAWLLSAVGSLASESKVQGINNEYDCSNYQLFKLCFWDMFYKTR
nr:MAG TPA: hypothetical protein [Caudoviricetes sp.]